MKLLRTIRLDPSDAFVFNRAAEPGEWAVSGAFVFWEQPVDALVGKECAAFRSGLLGISSLGWSTLAIVSEASDDDRQSAIHQLADQLVRHFGAPDRRMAEAAAEQELAFSAQLAEPAVGTLVAVRRTFEAGEIRERFRTLLPGGDDLHSRAFHFEAVGDEPEERVDLMTLSRPDHTP